MRFLIDAIAQALSNTTAMVRVIPAQNVSVFEKSKKVLNYHDIKKQSPNDISLLKAGIVFCLQLCKLAYL